MIRDITLGQFFPGNSILHRLDPSMKIVLTLVYIVAVFCAKSVSGFMLILALTALMTVISRISFSTLLKSAKPVLFIIIFTAVVNIFWSTGETTLFRLGFIHVTLEGVMYAAMMIVRILCLLFGTGVLLTYTTSPIALTDGLERLLNPLKKLHVPVHDFSMMMSTALRFIPTLVEETDKIMSAQKSRGADFSSGSLIRRIKALLPIIIPLFISALNRAEELATAMECRCYRGGEGRTRMNHRRLSPYDFLALAVFALSTAAVISVNLFFPIYSI